MNALTTTRIATSSPSVMMATANAGLPTIGRIATRSTPRAAAPVTTAATGRASQNPSGPTRYVTSTAPAIMNAGCAKLMTLVAL